MLTFRFREHLRVITPQEGCYEDEVGEMRGCGLVGLKRLIDLLYIDYGREGGFKVLSGEDGEVDLC